MLAQNLLAQTETLSSSISSSPAPPSLVSLTEGVLTQRLGPEWKGILYVCNPYCQFISLKEINEWKPKLPSLKIQLEHIKGVAHTDPLYPLLISKNPVLPFVQKDKKEDPPLTNPNIKDQPFVIPSYAKSKFNYAFPITGGLDLQSSTWQSNSQIQSNLSTEDLTAHYFLTFAFIKGQPFQFYKQFIQPQLEITNAFQLGSYRTKDLESNISQTLMEIKIQGMVMKKGYKWGMGYLISTEDLKSTKDTLTHYSVNQQNHFLRWLWNYKRYIFTFDYLLSSQIKEAQQYRAEPFKIDRLRLGIEYHTQDFQLFDFDYGLFTSCRISQAQQSAGIDSSIVSQQQSLINVQNISLQLGVRMGEDIFK